MHLQKGEQGLLGWSMQASPPECGTGSPPTSVFIETPSLGDCQPRLKSLSPAHETNLSPPEVNLVFLGLGEVLDQSFPSPRWIVRLRSTIYPNYARHGRQTMRSQFIDKIKNWTRIPWPILNK